MNSLRNEAASILEAMKPFDPSRRFRSPAALLLLLFFALALLLPAQEPVPPVPTETLRVEVGVVNLYCTVKEKSGRLVTSLAAEDFEVREDGQKQQIKYFTRETDRPLTLALLVDTSISQQAVLAIEKDAATQFFQQVLRPVDMALLITFDVNVDLLQDFTQEVEPLERALQRARINAPVNLGPFPRTGITGTRLYDAVYLASREKMAPEVGRKAIILVSDGVDAGSDLKEMDALEAAQRSDTIIYAIGIADPDYYRGAIGRGYSGSGTLKKLAEDTGGRAYFPSNPEKLQEAFDQIGAELRSQYSLGYSPTNRARDGRFRKIEVKVKGKDLRVQARRGYYAPRS